MQISANVVLPLFGIGLGIFVLFIVGSNYLSSKSVDQWLVAQGVIRKLNIKYGGASYVLDLRYQYSVLGQEYQGFRVSLSPKQTFKREVVQEWMSEYPIGKKVDVFYNPEKPHIAVLEKGFSLKSALVMIGLGFFLIVCNALFLLIAFLWG